ncbi:NADH-quinone oxidoreductase subunit NuoF [Sulfobacillus harzensis]|uniref:NADH-quinone oxidoreductase subunit F n=1 Tax=Sulfobacillus harzensis TaxID=2729629 RepID=A0A7Y0Q3S0_9FIRM|nr:NADH-quinone oxidoreductase subunit NuoF [Sulfobacillus harzensis]NMP23675.1 NADH-quinone oxidoreductase subunit NuoF [Sulfobacillus harzensis]
MHYLLRHRDIPNLDQLSVYRDHGGYDGLRQAVSQDAERVLDEVSRSGLRGRGGAGFPTGRKWSFLDRSAPTRYLVGADEAEPGTFKDRELIEHNPHQVIEGALIAAYALKAEDAFIFVRGELLNGYESLLRARDEAKQAGYIGPTIFGSSFSVNLRVFRSAGAYICGEETALLESLEGKRGHPRVKPPFPALVGLYGAPTVVNNAETVANLPQIMIHGADWYRQYGTPDSPGLKIFSVSGRIARPGNYELPLATPLDTLLQEFAGGPLPGHAFKAVIPGGSSVPLLVPDNFSVPLDYESLAKAGSMLGSGGVMVLDDTVCMVRAAARLLKFYRTESCGKCTPCREGTYWMTAILERIESGAGTYDDLDRLPDIADNVSGKCLCPLGDASLPFMLSAMKYFRSEFIQHIEEHGCPMAPVLPTSA